MAISTTSSDGKNENVAALRGALLNWFPFPSGKRALLLGSGNEALLPLLQRHYGQVDTALDPAARYDCIVAVDLAEQTADFPAKVQALREVVHEEGVLLLFYRNRFGLKYLTGGLDEYVSVPFSTLDTAKEAPRLYARHEMDSCLTKAGWEISRYYYLMPEMSFVQAVYTDDLLPTDSIRDRVMPFDLYNSPLIAWEGDLYDDVVREGTLPAVANVYLAECRKKGAMKPSRQVVYAALSTDRGKEHGFATILYSDDTALKTALFPEGRPILEAIYDHSEQLSKRGLLVVPQELSEEGITMPLVKEEHLLHYLRRQLENGPEAFADVFRQIEKDVLQSSPLAKVGPEDTGPEDTHPKDTCPRDKCPRDMKEIWGADEKELGPILERAWIDMIPYNAFWAEGRIRYFDQEFQVDHCPAKYVLFRALRYTYIHIPEAEGVLSLEKAKERFGLTSLWDGFFRREEQFISENRNWASYGEIHAHWNPDREEMKARREDLLPFDPLPTVHAFQLELLKELKRVCEANGLTYMAIHGTLLGAVRHQGFIPWDDDVDIAMPRKDYDKLIALGNKAFSNDVFLQTPLNNYGCYYGGYSKLRRQGTWAQEPQNEGKAWRNCHQGIWIDIFPLDGCPADRRGQKRLQRRLSFRQRIIFAKAYPLPKFPLPDVSGAKISLYYWLSHVTRRRWLTGKIDALCKRHEHSALRGILCCYYGDRVNKNIWPAEAVSETVLLPFEDMELPVPKGYDTVLTTRYGKNYRKLPPKEKRYRHSKVVFHVGKERASQ